MNDFEKAVSEIDERTGNSNDENIIESPDDSVLMDYSPNSRNLMTVFLSRKKWVNRIMEYAEKYPDEVQIKHVNADSSIVAHVPVGYLHIYRPRELSEETKEKLRKNLKTAADD